MHFTSSLPVVYIALSTLYHGTAALSADSSVLDFRGLILPNGGSPIPLGDFGGNKFQNIEVVRMATQTLGTDTNDGVIADFNDPLHPGAGTLSTTVAIIDPKTASSGGRITIPAGKRLESFNFFCCSSKAGESILEGHGCKQMKCRATAQSSGVGKDGKKIKYIDGTAVAASSKAVTKDAPGAITSNSLLLGDSTADFAAGEARETIITFTSGAISRAVRGKRAAGMKGSEGMILVITDMVISSMEENEAA